MKFLYKIWGVIYHIYYFIVMALVITLISPFILYTSFKEERYEAFFKWSRVWAKLILIFMGYHKKINWLTNINKDERYIIVANHSSEIDIMMALSIIPNCFVFIGKKELGDLPLFGYFYKRTNILVDRKSIQSKKNVMVKAAKKLDEGIGLCIFPEGGIPDPSIDLGTFKMGAFKLAIENNYPILPITFIDNKKKFPAFMDGGYPGRLRATVHPVIDTTAYKETEVLKLKDECYNLIHGELKSKGVI